MTTFERGRVARSRGPVVAAALVAAVLAGGCGGSGSDTASPTTTQAAALASQATSTTESPDDTETTEAPGAVSGAAALGSRGSGRRDGSDDGGGSSTARTPAGAGVADEEAPDVTWASTALDYRGEDGLLVAYDCPPDGVIGAVWGTDVYTDDSSVCTAAVHLGLLDPDEGGVVTIQISGGLDAYEGSTANGVTSSSYGPWSGSFTIVDVG